MNLDDIHILAETQNLVVGHIYERAYIIRKDSNLIEEIGSLYGDTQCGLIDVNDNWCIVAGDSVLIWMQGKTTHLTNPNLRWVTKMRQADNKTIQLLTDPWSDNPAIWKLDVYTLKTSKISEFNHMKNQPYTDRFEW
ncbi:hypothetical protein AAEO56_19120 [Flavobacterium sp. DGU11]|uniref:Uncharacterized protein n=1 Tax=Flavobacterium arundinis TaxID=3139143 RepID=A0ABU9I1U8_9FLAO